MRILLAIGIQFPNSVSPRQYHTLQESSWSVNQSINQTLFHFYTVQVCLYKIEASQIAIIQQSTMVTIRELVDSLCKNGAENVGHLFLDETNRFIRLIFLLVSTCVHVWEELTNHETPFPVFKAVYPYVSFFL